MTLQYTEEEKVAIRAQLREGNQIARREAAKHGVKVHPRVAKILASRPPNRLLGAYINEDGDAV